MSYIHNDKCEGGKPFKEVDGNNYCLGLLDMAYEYKYSDKCLGCPKFINNNEEKIEQWIKENKE